MHARWTTTAVAAAAAAELQLNQQQRRIDGRCDTLESQSTVFVFQGWQIKSCCSIAMLIQQWMGAVCWNNTSCEATSLPVDVVM